MTWNLFTKKYRPSSATALVKDDRQIDDRFISLPLTIHIMKKNVFYNMDIMGGGASHYKKAPGERK